MTLFEKITMGTAIMGVITAAFALFASIWQGWVARTHNKLSVTPHLAISSTIYFENGIVEFLMSNNGVGPAVVTFYGAMIDGIRTPFRSAKDSAEAFSKLGVRDKTYAPAHVIFAEGEYLKVGERGIILSFSHTAKNNEYREKVITCMSRFEFLIEYECVYGRKFVLRHPAYELHLKAFD